MGRPLVSSLPILLLLSLSSAAQMDTGDDVGPSKRASSPARLSPQIFISGRVVMEDGTPPPDRAEVETVCNGLKRTRAHTDSRGGFSFTFSSEGNSPVTQSASAGPDTSWGGPMAGGGDPEWQGCELQAELAGFISQKISFAQRIQGPGQTNVGQIVLHSMGPAEGLTLSVTSALAPDNAHKAFRRGLEQEQKHNWQDAEASLKKAVELYPRYAIAWFELGRVQAQQDRNSDAKRCWQQAAAADPKYLPPYQMLAQIALAERSWLELVDVTGKWLALDAGDFADAWFLNGVGNYLAGSLQAAEQSARQGIKVDQSHRIPKLQYLLGMILMQKQAYAEAAENMQLYLHSVSKPADVSEAQRQLAEIERRSSRETTVEANKR